MWWKLSNFYLSYLNYKLIKLGPGSGPAASMVMGPVMVMGLTAPDPKTKTIPAAGPATQYPSNIDIKKPRNDRGFFILKN
jgi:hypothetical protein